MGCASCASKAEGQSVRHKSTSGTTWAKNGKKDFWGNSMSYKWADPTWHFFHSLSGKIHEDFYKANTAELFNMITNINMVLPCPDCQKHAGQFFKNIRYTNYPTKESFRRLLISFHNFLGTLLILPQGFLLLSPQLFSLNLRFWLFDFQVQQFFL